MKLPHVFVLSILIVFSFFSCSKSESTDDDPQTDPSKIKTVSVLRITQVKAICKCTFSSDVIENYKVGGVCWTIDSNPTLKHSWNPLDYYNKIAYDYNLSGTYLVNKLRPNTTYYVRAYAYNETDTIYGNVITFKTLPMATYGSVADGEGNSYKTIKIGDQTWMAENLKTTKYNNGTAIDYLPTDISAIYYQKGYYCEYNRTASNASVYGRLYNGYVITNNICPTGWHIPSSDEVKTLYKYLANNYYSTYGDSANQYSWVMVGKALSAVSNLWATHEDVTVGFPQELNNASGFSAIPGGYYYAGARIFTRKDTMAQYWTSSYQTLQIDSRSDGNTLGSLPQSSFAAIRCIKD